MKAVSIPASDITRFNRMDAGFHIAYQGVKARVAELESLLGESEARELLAGLPAGWLAPVDPLATGAQARADEKTRRGSCERYPFIALALIEAALQGLLTSAQERVERAVAEKDVLFKFAAQIPKGPRHD